MRSLAEVFRLLPTTAENGLTEEGQARSRQQFGQNCLTPLPREPVWKKFLEKFDEPIIKILLAAALLSMAVDLFKAKAYFAGGFGVGLIVVGVAGLLVLRLSQWIPSLLFGLAIILFFAGLATGHALVEGLAVMLAVILATGVAFLSEYKSDREFEVLNARKDAITVKTIRAGAFHTVQLEEVVVGDVAVLETGDEIPADGRLVKATDLFIDQSLMTGESEPVAKQALAFEETAHGPEHPGSLYRGTQVVDGVGQMVVTEVGDATYLGQIARRLSIEDDEQEEGGLKKEETRVKRKLTISKEQTPLQQKLARLAKLISKVGYIAAILIFLALIFRGVLNGAIFFPSTGAQAFAVFGELLDAFVLMVIIIVVAVPEGLPMSVTISLAFAMRKMTRANSLVRQLVACETIGSATVICSDKTGTLTQNKMQVVRLNWDGATLDRGTANWATLPPIVAWPHRPIPLDWIVLNAGVNSTANLEEKNGKQVIVGNSTEGALLQWLRENRLEYSQIRLAFPSLYQIHFSSERKRMTTVVRVGDRLAALAKGAPEWLLENSTHYLGADGAVHPWTQAAREKVVNGLRDASSQAMRTLGFGYSLLPPEMPAAQDDLHGQRETLETDLTFVGFAAIRDPLRDDVKEAIQQSRAAGIQVKMVTGDNVETARAIARDIGLLDRADLDIDAANSSVLTSARFNELDDDGLKKRLPTMAVLARARPLDKFRLVKLLQEMNEVVAVTGDGTNDAPALKKADVGLAMGIAGTEVAKVASKIVLLDDSFATIVKAVHWGRSLYENIQRFIQFQLTINVSALTIAFLGPLIFGVKAPFTVLQLLWINVIMDTFASIALCSEPPRPGVMGMAPKKRDEDILSPAMKQTIFGTALFFVVVMLGLLVLMKGSPDHPGLFADQGTRLWSFESAGSRTAQPSDNLQRIAGSSSEWQLKTDPETMGEVSFTVFQVSLFFSIYVFFQVWNQINCRSLTPAESGFHRLFSNPVFLLIAGTVAIGQILIATFGGVVFKVEPLGVIHWVGVIAFTSTVLLFAEAVRRLRLRNRT
jgi:Ca2+-transporting ATPase